MKAQSHLPQTNNLNFHCRHGFNGKRNWLAFACHVNTVTGTFTLCTCLSDFKHGVLWTLCVLVLLTCVVNSLCSWFADVCCELSAFLFCWRVVNSLCSCFADVCCELSVFLFCRRALWTRYALALLTIFVSSRQTFNVMLLKLTFLLVSSLLTITGLGLLVLRCCSSFLCSPPVSQHVTRGVLPVADGTLASWLTGSVGALGC